MGEQLEQVLADERGQAQVLRHNGHKAEAEIIERVCDRVGSAAEEYLRFLWEDDAMLRSNRARDWFRSRFAEWEAEGNARKVGNRRYYRMLIVPRRANLSAAREEGKRIGMKKSA
jgi:hypothetical protein